MWRSVVAARASLSRCSGRKLSITNTRTSKTLFQSPSASSTSFCLSRSTPPHNRRFFSQLSSNVGDSELHLSESSHGDISVSPEAEQFSESFGENDGAQAKDWQDSVSSGEISSALLNGSAHDELNEQFSASNDENATQMENEGGVHEINVEQLENLLSLLQSSFDGSLESILDEMSLNLNEEFVVRVLETPSILGENLISFFKWASKDGSEFKVTSRVVDALVRSVCRNLRKKDAYALWDLVKDVGEKEKNDVISVESLNELISLCSKLGKAKAAMEIFNKFEDFYCEPNADTYYFTIDALCRRSFFDWALSISEKMIDAGKLPDAEKVGKIISWFCKGKKAKDAYLIYTLAKEKELYPPGCSINFLISSLCREDDNVKLALEMLDDFAGKERKYAIKPFSAVIQGLCRTKDVSEAKKLLLKMIASGPPPGNAVFNSVIHGFSKAGDVGEAVDIMKLMGRRGLKPDVYTYTVIISAYVNGGQMDEACKMLSQAKRKHSQLSPVTYHTLIRGYCKLEDFDKALKLLAEMKDHGVQTNVDEYNKLIQSLCLKALDWERAEKLLEEMKEKGLHLNGITRGLIRAVKEIVIEEVETTKTSLEA
ncbi:small ribosomal subunit protein mS80 (rPPR6) [Humulus lupulus]|uniref:small ribosomal subunit protein mS80 (rPPR6) n=1 Tax=Humulus lupulus TaxID=3486 RepID=UPI002B40CAC7|nr:small ribosomal subunit protein mS80 (rPPR6) [Humulus lupulus]XP_062082442.1 small ribosomal subunit protein mS80 (rPPR6) [Humulus lupulus]